MNYHSNPASNLKNGAELLLRGGSLLNISCNNCGGVQIRYKDKIICINCGLESTENKNNVNVSATTSQEQELDRKKETHGETTPYNTIFEFDKIIIQKVSNLLNSLKNDDDPTSQVIKIDLINKYLEILDRIRKI
jgi:uncharacterized Zn finger protein (UPF0148 family)